MHEPMIPEVSIVIASHRKDYVQKCVDRFTEKIIGRSPVEVIIVADYPIDGFAAPSLAVQWIYCAERSIPLKRNRGIALAKGRIVGFIDDDCMPFENWVDCAIRSLKDNPGYAGVAGKTVVERREGVSYPFGEFKRLEIPSFRTNNIFYRKEILIQNGGFDERFSVQREDIDLAFSLLEKGLVIGYDHDIQVTHCSRQGERWDLMKNCINRRFDPLLYRKHKKLYREKIVTPFTPSIALVLLMHGLVVVGFGFGETVLGIAVGMDVMCSLAMGIRRNCHIKIDIVQLLCDGVSYLAAPFVLLGALVYGSIKFRRLLLF